MNRAKSILLGTKKFAVEYTKIFTMIIIGIILVALSGVLVLHALWQIDLFALPFIWKPAHDNLTFYQDLIANGIPAYHVVPAQDFLLKCSVGELMDTMLTFAAIGWCMGMIGVGIICLSIIMLLTQYNARLKAKLNLKSNK